MTFARIDFRSLQQLLRKDSDEILSQIAPKKGKFMQMVGSDAAMDDSLERKLKLLPLLLQVILKAFDASMSDEIKHSFMMDLLSSRFFNGGLFVKYVGAANRENSGSQDDLKRHSEVMDHTMEVLRVLYDRYEEASADELHSSRLLLEDFVQKQTADNPFIPRDLIDRLNKLKDLHERIQKRRAERKQLARHAASNGSTVAKPAAVTATGASNFDYRNHPIIPNVQILNEKADEVLSSIPAVPLKGPFVSLDAYLETQVRLLLEDFVGPLREGLRAFRDSLQQQPARRIQDIRVYEDVHVVSAFGHLDSGIAYRLRFSTNRLKGVSWQQSKRLSFGSLVCLSDTGFQTAYFGTVADRNPKDLQKGVVTVRFERPSAAEQQVPISEVSPTVKFTMIESEAYFEAYKHVLDRLQKLGAANDARATLAFQKYFVQADMKPQPPVYLQGPAVQINMLHMLTDKARAELQPHARNALERVPILRRDRWPSAAQLGLADAQFEALHYAMTNEMAVIVGPPGTGKTFIGYRICELLLRNPAIWNRANTFDAVTSPILLVCYTNHALDQFLTGIMQLSNRGVDLPPGAIVRIGGRVKPEYQELVEPVTLRHLRELQRNEYRIPPELTAIFREIRGNLNKYRDELSQINAELEALDRGIARLDRLKRKLTGLQVSDRLTWQMLGWFGSDEALQRWLLGYTAFENQWERELAPDDQPERVTPNWLLEEAGTKELAADEDFDATVDQIDELSLRDRWRLYRCWLRRPAENTTRTVENLRAEIQLAETRLADLTQVPAMERPEQRERRETNVRNIRTRVLQNERVKNQEQARLDRIRVLIELDPDNEPQLSLNRPNLVSIREFANEIRPEFFDHFNRMATAGNVPVDDAFCAWLLPPHQAGENDNESEELVEVVGDAQRLTETRLLDDQFAAIAQRQNAAQNRADAALRAAERQTIGLTIEQLERSVKGDGKAKQSGIGNDGFRTSNKDRASRLRRVAKVLRDGLAHRAALTDNQLRALYAQGPQKLKVQDRWAIYNRWVAAYKQALSLTVREQEKAYDTECRKLEDARRQQDYALLKNASLIALTTTGASMHHSLLDRVAPRIVMVEEAAEVLEAHVIASLSSRCEHLILIGDHKQLRPTVNMVKLAKAKNLDVSVFERLILNGLQFRILDTQHRMSPAISRLTKHFYKNDVHMNDVEIKDHESVNKYEPVRGVLSSLYFFTHESLEETDADNRSHSNRFEAEIIPPFVKYLIQQGYKPSQITVLTMYTGQLFMLRQRMPKREYDGVILTAVDNYQGEENDIVILSLVRSNKEKRIGFVAIQNRILVSLSRARIGLYVFGNFGLLREVSEDWRAVLDCVELAKNPPMLGRELTLCCVRHPERSNRVRSAADFRQVPEGGCGQMCGTRLPCGHACARSCHAYDLDHKQFYCTKTCGVTHCKVPGHVCQVDCGAKEHVCRYPIKKTLPCGHDQVMECWKNPADHVCEEKSGVILDCGHVSRHRCGESTRMRKAEQDCETGTIVRCIRHERRVPCRLVRQTTSHDCDRPCESVLADCEHICDGKCGGCMNGRLHLACQQKCNRVLICGHACKVTCAKQCPPCDHACENRCTHSRCHKQCGEPCVPCAEPCDNKCEHSKCTRRCSEPCNKPRCSQRCGKLLKCKHQCIGVCGERCPTVCRVCDPENEIFEIFLGSESDEDALFIILEDCNHVICVSDMDTFMDMIPDSAEIIMKWCPRCKVPIRRTRRYKTIVNTILQDIEAVKLLARGNMAADQVAAYRDQVRAKLETVPVDYRNDDRYKQYKTLAASGKDVAALQLIDNWVNFVGNFSRLEAMCPKVNLEVVSFAVDQVKVGQSNASFPIVADAAYEIKLSLSLLRRWLLKQRRQFSDFERVQFQGELSRMERLSQILCVYAQCFDVADVSTKSPSRQALSRLQLEGQQLIKRLRSEVYSEALGQSVELWMKACKDMGLISGIPGISNAERLMIVKAIGLTPGHWFKCPNGHIYAIGECGGAMQQSRCPECKSTIGGANHRLTDGNSLAREMDNAPHAAWSDQANMANYVFD